MRFASAIICLSVACFPAARGVCAQEPYYEPQELEPQAFPRRVSIEAEPLLAPPPRDAGSPRPFPIRQVTATENATEVLPRATENQPLRLAPRGTSGKRSLDRPAAATPSGAIGTVVASLAIVLGLFLAFAWAARRFAPAGSAMLPKEAVELLGRAPLAGRQQMQLIRVGNKLLLVAMSAGGAETLTEITDPVEVEHLAGLCRRGKTDSASASFNRVLTQLATDPSAETARTRSRGAT
ncbi:MAG: flagellar biosynthetic protein FliO [Pirellulaceae bacterium]